MLALRKTKWIQSILKTVHKEPASTLLSCLCEERGKTSMEFLRKMDKQTVHSELERFQGIGKKTSVALPWFQGWIKPRLSSTCSIATTQTWRSTRTSSVTPCSWVGRRQNSSGLGTTRRGRLHVHAAGRLRARSGRPSLETASTSTWMPPSQMPG